MKTKTLDEHPTVKAVQTRHVTEPTPTTLDAGWLRQLCLNCGADDVGFVSIDRPDLDGQRDELLAAFPRTRVAISFVCRMNRENIRNPARSAANVEFHHVTDQTSEVARQVVRALELRGVAAFYPAPGFPMEVDRAKIWIVSHKPLAVAAGLGRMGLHRNVIHPRFGNFILLGTVLVAADVTEETKPIDFNPCLDCKLCVAACPVGAIDADGHFNLTTCYTHNYREFMGGFGDWVENVAESGSRAEYRSRVTPEETKSMWQSLSFGANYKAAYCMAVCPAGEDVITPFLKSRKDFTAEVLRPLQAKVEPIYAVKGSDAEDYVRRRFPHKKLRLVHNGLTPQSIEHFFGTLKVGFQRGQSAGLEATYHFVFTGEEPAEGTVVIRDGTIHVSRGLQGVANLRVQADSQTWIRFLNGEANMPWSLLRRKVKLQGPLKLLLAFGRCFPS